MRWLRHSLLVELALVLLGGTATLSLLWVTGTEKGAVWVMARLVKAAPELTIEGVRGSLLGDLRLENVRWRSARDELDFEQLALDWNATAVLRGTLGFNRVAVSRASYRRLPAQGGAVPGGPPELPWPIRLTQATVATLDVTVAGGMLRFTDTRAAATFAAGRIEIDALATRTGDVSLTGQATIGLREAVELDVTADWAAPIAGVPANGAVTLTGAWPALRVQHTLAAPFAATSDGTIDFSGAARVALTTEWQAMAWPGVDTVASPSGRLTLTGELDAYRYEGAGTVDALGRIATFAVRGTGERLELIVEDLALSAPQGNAGTLRAQGTASLATRDARLEVSADDFDPASLFAAWPGRLDGTVMLLAGLLPAPSAAFEAVELAGELRGYPVTLRGAVAFAPGEARLDELRLESAGNRVAVTGTLDAASLDLAVTAELGNLDLVVPAATGTLTGEVAVTGSWQEPRARGRLTARALAYAGVTVAQLDVEGEIGLAPATPLSLTLAANGMRRGSVALDRIETVLVGTTAAHTATVEASAEQWRATVVADGGLTDGLWSGVLQRLEIDERLLGAWRLDAPAALTLGPRHVTLATSCLLHASRARFCSELDVRGRKDDQVVVSAQNFDLATLRPVLPPELVIDGVYQLSASLVDVLGEPHGALAITSTTTRARVELSEAQTFATELNNVRVGMTLAADRLELEASVMSTAGGSAAVNAHIADLRARDSAIDGALRVEWPDLGFLALLSPNLEQVAGRLAVDLTLAGTVAEPTLDGRATLSDGRIGMPRWGLIVEGIEATATSADGRTLDFAATGRAREGVLTLAGATVLDPAAGWPTRLTLRGDTVPVVQLPNAEIFATPDLAIDVALPRVTITGSVHVPRASLELEALPEQAVQPSPDAVVHGGVSRPNRAQPLRISTAIDVTLGDDVRYAALNLDTKVSGRLRFESEPNRSATAVGTLELTGTYNAYGQILELEQGQLLFSGPLDNPGLNVRAVRDLSDSGLDPRAVRTNATEVGVELTGTVQAPRTRVFSTPAMNEADALSYLLFGQPTRGTGGGLGAEQNSTLEVAALSLGLQQALPAVQRIGTTLGLDELAVRSTAAEAGEVMAGKYLSPRVYIRYSYGLFNRIGGLLLRFKVNERWSIETNSGEQESMDLLYTVEKD